jgi:hypothetical protein
VEFWRHIFRQPTFYIMNVKSPETEEKNMYIDPNTGGILFQALAGILAAVSGVLLFFSRQIRQGIARLRRRFRKDDEA